MQIRLGRQNPLNPASCPSLVSTWPRNLLTKAHALQEITRDILYLDNLGKELKVTNQEKLTDRTLPQGTKEEFIHLGRYFSVP